MAIYIHIKYILRNKVRGAKAIILLPPLIIGHPQQKGGKSRLI